MRLLYIVAFPAMILSLALASGCAKQKAATAVKKSKLAINCVPLPADKIKWTIEQCGPFLNGETVLVSPETIGFAPSGVDYAPQALGAQSLNKGFVTFTITNLDYTDMPWPTNDIVLAVFMARSDEGAEINWHILGNRFASWGWVQTRLVTQRFDGVCIPEEVRFCEKKDEDYDMPAYDRKKVFRFDCEWDTTRASQLYGQGPDIHDGLVACKIFNVTDPKNEFLVRTYNVAASGPYPQLRYFLVGGNASRGYGMEDTPTRMTNVRFTLLPE